MNIPLTARSKFVPPDDNADKGPKAIDWAVIDKFREGLRNSKASVTALRKRARY